MLRALISSMVILFFATYSHRMLAQESDSQAVNFFETRIRPVLIKHCYECHSSAAARLKGGLLLDSREGVQRGGSSGAIVVPGKPEESLLIQALKHQGPKMPPGMRLPEDVVAAFEHWVKIGAPDPRTQPVAHKKPGNDLWSLKPIVRPVVPAVLRKDWPRSNIDRFILAALESKEQSPAADAEAHTLLRRLHFVLTGLPPTPEQLAAFRPAYMKNPRQAYERTMDDLSASPHFGERWARHWLDLARYADASGSTAPVLYPEAWRYREYVIDAFNRDKPFDRFVREQIAGDLLPAVTSEEHAAGVIATAYLGLFHIVAADRDPEKRALDVVDEQLDVLGKNFLGISLGCARCHDHKLDPVSTRDYYALAGILRSTASVTGGFGSSNPVSVPLDNLPETAPSWMRGDKIKVLAVRDEDTPQDVAIRLRGEVTQKGDIVPRGFPSLVHMKFPPRISAEQSGRLQLADWLLSPENPLVARVIVNRVWHHVFGQGLVRTTDNFGSTGELPSHPELLDYLAVRFREQHRWSFKSLIKELLLTRTWQQSARGEAKTLDVDPENRLLARANRWRLDAESLHDGIHHVADRLDLVPATLTAPKFSGGNQASTLNLTISEEVLRKRAVYWPVFRKDIPSALDMLSIFDMPAATSPRGTRAVSVVPAQGLFLFNSPMVLASAEALCARVLEEPGTDAQRVTQLYLRLFAREPRAEECARAQRFVADYARQLPAGENRQRLAWTGLCHTLMISNEFLVVE